MRQIRWGLRNWRGCLLTLLYLLGLSLYMWHLWTGEMSDRVAYSFFGLELYWSAVLHTAALFLSTAVVVHIAHLNGRRLFEAAVPQAIREQSVNDFPVDKTTQTILNRRRYGTIGRFLWWWGLTPRYLGMRDTQLQSLGQTLLSETNLRREWLVDPPWRPWNPFHAWRSLIWLLVGGLLGARLYYILFLPPSRSQFGAATTADFLQSPLQLLSIRDGGLGFYGLFLGGLIGLFLYTARHRLPFLLWADLAVVGLALGQSLGRWGHFLNQEWFGRPTMLPWAVTIASPFRLPAYADQATYHPLFLYESLWTVALFFLLYYLATRHYAHLRRGDLLACYTILYSFGRLLWEPLRLDAAPFGWLGIELPAAMVIALSLLFLMAAWRRFSYL